MQKIIILTFKIKQNYLITTKLTLNYLITNKQRMRTKLNLD